MNKETKTGWDFWWVALMALTYAVTAWLMALAQWAYPPVPMFVAALAGGWLFRGRPHTAARASLWTGFAWGWIAEWAYIAVRLNDPAGEWAQAGIWERLGLGGAEIMLYTALLSFFAAFIAWGAEKPQSAQTALPVDSSEPQARRQPEIPFQPEELETPQPRKPGSR